MNLEYRARAFFGNLTGMVKTFLPVAFADLIIDMCKTLEELKEKQK
jgi:hypothetical protein